MGAHYFSTHGCNLFVSFGGGALDDEPFAAAASLRALMSKKLAMIALLGRNKLKIPVD